jgi:hypothetical protein
MTGLVQLLQEFYRDKLDTVLRHQAGARLVAGYDANNVYQYAINRGEVQLSWVRGALEDLGGAVPDTPPEPGRGAGNGAAQDDARILGEDAQAAAAFVAKWTPRVEAMENDRHRKMLRVILGEMIEQQRSFDQSLAGRTDVLGRHNPHNDLPMGQVLGTRWVE